VGTIFLCSMCCEFIFMVFMMLGGILGLSISVRIMIWVCLLLCPFGVGGVMKVDGFIWWLL